MHENKFKVTTDKTTIGNKIVHFFKYALLFELYF